MEARLRDVTQIEGLLRFLDHCDAADVRSFAATLCKEDVPLEWRQKVDETDAWTRRLRGAAARTEGLISTYAEEGSRGERRVIDTLRYMARLFESPVLTPGLRRQRRLLDERWPAARNWKPGEPTYRELQRFASAVVGCDDRTMEDLIEWLRPFVETFRREYTRRGFVSFQGLLVRAARILRDHPDVRDQLKRRFRLVLVDEFQDTDPLQGEILLFLAERADRCETDSRRVEIEPGKLVITWKEYVGGLQFRGAIKEVLRLSLVTLLMALLATTLGSLFAIPLSFLAARNIMGNGPIGRAVYSFTRTVFNLWRSIEPMILVVICAAWVGIGPFAGVIALGLNNIPNLGKLFSETIEEIDTGPDKISQPALFRIFDEVHCCGNTHGKCEKKCTSYQIDRSDNRGEDTTLSPQIPWRLGEELPAQGTAPVDDDLIQNDPENKKNDEYRQC